LPINGHVTDFVVLLYTFIFIFFIILLRYQRCE